MIDVLFRSPARMYQLDLLESRLMGRLAHNRREANRLGMGWRTETPHEDPAEAMCHHMERIARLGRVLDRLWEVMARDGARSEVAAVAAAGGAR